MPFFDKMFPEVFVFAAFLTKNTNFVPKMPFFDAVPFFDRNLKTDCQKWHSECTWGWAPINNDFWQIFFKIDEKFVKNGERFFKVR